MKREILASCDEEEVRVAIVEDGRLTEFYLDREGEHSPVGSIYKGRIENVLDGIQACFVDVGWDKNLYLPYPECRTPRQELAKGRPVLVQVVKEAIGEKGAKGSEFISLPGHYLVYAPYAERGGVSRAITDPDLRRKLRRLLEEISPEKFGATGDFIFRTEAQSAGDGALRKEAEWLLETWKKILQKAEQEPAPSLIAPEPPLVVRIARDYLGPEVEAYLLDDEASHRQVVEYAREAMTEEVAAKVGLYSGQTSIFSLYDIERQIDKLRSPRIDLPSGGFLVIQQAESLTAVDVNSGRFTRGKNLEDTSLKTNLEAAEEIARQIRARNLGGLIVIDFIDLRRAQDRHKVLQALHSAMAPDRANVKILPMTKLGLVEISRERRTESLLEKIGDPCPTCRGRGQVLSPASMFIRIKREILALAKRSGPESVRVKVHPDVARYMDEKRLAVLEGRVGRQLHIQPDPSIHREDFQISFGR